MKLTITGRHINVTESVKLYAAQKLKHIIEKHEPARITKAHIIMDVQRYQQVVEIELHGPHSNIYSKTASPDMYTSIDKVIDKIEKQLIKLKSKYDRKRHRELLSIRIQSEEV